MNKNQPPKFFEQLFRWFCNPDFFEELQGDLLEQFHNHLEDGGPAYANKQYTIAVLNLFRPSVIKPFSISLSEHIPIAMLQNYFKVAIRNLWKNTGTSLINIFGLTLGMAGCLLIGIFVADEWKFDKQHPDHEQVYRVYTERFGNGEEMFMASGSPMIGPTFTASFPEVESSLRLYQVRQKLLFAYEDKSYLEDKGFFAEGSIFDMFHLPFLYGDSHSALSKPNAIVLTASKAMKYFGNENPIGKSLVINGRASEVSGVIEDLSPYFHLDFDFLLSFSTLERMVSKERMQSWIWQDFCSYVKLDPLSDLKVLEAKFYTFAEKEIHPQTKEMNFYYYPYLQNVKDIHLYSSNFRSDVAVRSNHIYIKGLIGIAIFLLLIACINFINLATARAVNRAKEVGIRKATGALRGQLAFQFVGEATLVAFVSAVFAIILSLILLPSLNDFTGKVISFSSMTNPFFILGTLAAIVLIGFLAGAYPAFIISGFKPVDSLKAAYITPSAQSQWLRKSLVVVQFGLSILLIISVFIVSQQISLLGKKDLGFQKEQLLHFPMKGKLFNNYESSKMAFLNIPGVKSVTACFGIPGDIVAGDNIIVPGEDRQNLSARMLMVDQDFIPTMGMEIIAGRDFSKEIATDAHAAFIINETAVKTLGLGKGPEEAIDKALEWPMWNETDSIKKGRVIGVVKDFHYASLHEQVQTAVLQIYPQSFWKMAIRLETGNLPGTLQAIEETWKSFETGFPIDYQFVDAGFGAMYKAENNWNTLVRIASFLAILIAGVGAFGLAAYATEQRRKEISIRKVLGASVSGIVALLSKDFLWLVLLALLLASPFAWYLMNNWLNGFAYRVDIQWWIFPLAGIVALLITFLTVGSQGLKAALSNPTGSLKQD